MYSWKDTKAEADAVHEANGTRATGEQKAAIRGELDGRVRAHRLVEIREGASGQLTWARPAQPGPTGPGGT